MDVISVIIRLSSCFKVALPVVAGKATAFINVVMGKFTGISLA